MQFKNIQFIWTIILTNLVYGAEKLVVSELNSVFNSSDVQWVSNSVFLCAETEFTEFSNQSVMGIFGQGIEISQKTFSSLPPHWSISVRFDLILYQSLDTIDGDCIYVKIEGVEDKYQKISAGGGNFLCQPTNRWADELVLYYRNFTHQSSSITVKLESNTDEPINNEGYAFKNFYIFVDTCHDTCLTCKGPAANQCLTCPVNSDKFDNRCQCRSGYHAQNNSCVRTCQSGFIQDATGQLCVQDFCDKSKCQSCDKGLCISCQPGFFLIDGQCVNKCPSYSTARAQKCEDLKSKTSNGLYLLKSMFDTYFGESEILGAGLKTSGFLGFNSQSSRALTTLCGDKTILGGAYLSSENAIISTEFNGLGPHWSVAIGYTLYKIDYWNSESVQLIVDGVVSASTVKSGTDGNSNICGRIWQDQIILVSQNITHSNSGLKLQIKSNLKGNPFIKSFGIRELYVLVDYCSSNCLECNASGCLKCKSTHYLYNFQCISACPDGYASDSNNVCKVCHSTCKTCSSPLSSTSCLTCNENSYLNPNQTCKSSCPDQYWGDNSNWQCKPCDTPCYNCQRPGNSQSCTSCSGTSYLHVNQCQSDCPPDTFKLAQPNNNICQTCDPLCKTCDGSSSNDCLSCEAPDLFYQQSSKSCSQNCNSNQFKNTDNQVCTSCHTLCASCSGPENNNCLSCSGNLFLYQNQCILECPENYFKNTLNSQCTQCHSSCQTCSGGDYDNCLSCSSPRLLDLNSHQCVSECSSNQFPDTSLNQCKPCHSTCLTCNGPLESNCIDCPQGLLFQENTCVQKCSESYYTNPFSSICQKCNSSCQTCFGPSESECTSCVLDLIYLNNSCLNECPKNYFIVQQNEIVQCFECHRYCQLGCTGPLKEDCDQIKYQYQIIIFIFVAVSFLWIVSSVIGYFLDKRQSKIFNSMIKSPSYVNNSERVSKISLKQDDNKQEDNQQQDQSQNNDELQKEQKNKSIQQQNHLEEDQTLNFLEQIMQSYITTKKINPRSKIPNSQKSVQILELQQTNLEQNHHSQNKMSSLCFPSIGTTANLNLPNNQTVFENQGQDKDSSQQNSYPANNKFKFTILGNEWVSLFYFYDSEATRVSRAILIFLKYQAFFLSSELIYSYFNCFLVCAITSKFVSLERQGMESLFWNTIGM